MLSYLRATGDTEYGCDERLQSEFFRYLLGLNSIDARIVQSYPQRLPDSSTGALIDYDEIQRSEYVDANSEFAAPPEPIRPFRAVPDREIMF